MRFEVDVARRIGGDEIACRFEAGEGLTVLFGRSGIGKTSVLGMVAGLLRPERGRVVLGETALFDAAAGIDLPPERRRIGYVFQEARLFPHMSVAANLAYGGGTGPLARAEVLRILDIEPLLDRRPATLSGGEARRIAIGRALLSNPALLLLDEPLSFLDHPRREEIMAMLEALRDTVRLPMLMVTHDAAEAERLATQIVRME
jgi:molybdate transport system ATP-binding protein